MAASGSGPAEQLRGGAHQGELVAHAEPHVVAGLEVAQEGDGAGGIVEPAHAAVEPLALGPRPLDDQREAVGRGGHRRELAVDGEEAAVPVGRRLAVDLVDQRPLGAGDRVDRRGRAPAAHHLHPHRHAVQGHHQAGGGEHPVADEHPRAGLGHRLDLRGEAAGHERGHADQRPPQLGEEGLGGEAQAVDQQQRPVRRGDAARHRLDPPRRRRLAVGAGDHLDGGVVARVAEPEELEGAGAGRLRVGELRHRLAAEAQGVRPDPGDRRQRLAQQLLGREEREHHVGRPPGLRGGGEQQLPWAGAPGQMDGSAPHDRSGGRQASVPAANSLRLICAAGLYARDRDGGRRGGDMVRHLDRCQVSC